MDIQLGKIIGDFPLPEDYTVSSQIAKREVASTSIPSCVVYIMGVRCVVFSAITSYHLILVGYQEERQEPI